MKLKRNKSKIFNIILSNKGDIPSLTKSKKKKKKKRKKKRDAKMIYPKTNKNMLPSLAQIFTQGSWSVHLPHPGSSHSEEWAPNKQVPPKSLKMNSQIP